LADYAYYGLLAVLVATAGINKNQQSSFEDRKAFDLVFISNSKLQAVIEIFLNATLVVLILRRLIFLHILHARFRILTPVHTAFQKFNIDLVLHM